MAVGSSRCLMMCLCLKAVLLLLLSGIASAQWAIKSLPGFSGELPFKLETGYYSVGENSESQLFYYFVESQDDPSTDPIMLWLTGGPGCSVISAFFYESGPLSFVYDNYTGRLPSLRLNEFTWTKRLSILYVDAPVGTGFSYSNSTTGWAMNDTASAAQTTQFLRKWFEGHPEYLSNQLFIGGDSYSGIIVPMIVLQIANENSLGFDPFLNLQGYVLGNPRTDSYFDENSKVIFSHRLALISDILYDSALEYCGGNYVDVNSTNQACEMALQLIELNIVLVNEEHVLEPMCTVASRGQKRRQSLERNPEDDLIYQPMNSSYWCRNYYHVLAGIYMNDKGVQEALHVRPETKFEWKRCNMTIAYTKNVLSSIEYHRNISDLGFSALVYSGDHDLSIPYVGTVDWIHVLNLTQSYYWQPWFVDGQVVGYWEKYLSSSGDYSLTFATVKGAGHVAPEYKPKECYALIDRWLARFPL